MNQKKEIEYVNTKTGEIFTGTAEQICKKFKITRTTMYRNLKRTVSPKPQNDTVQPKNDTVDNATVQKNETVEPPNVTNSQIVTSNKPKNVTVQIATEMKYETDPPGRYVPDNAIVTPDGQVKLERKPCHKCKTPTFHKENGLFQCFGECTPPKNTKKILYQPPKCDLSVLDEGLAAAVQRCIDHNKGKYFDKPGKYEPK
jgi:hypothetical protein